MQMRCCLSSGRAVQGAKHFKDIRYSEGVTYGEMFLQNEYEWSGTHWCAVRGVGRGRWELSLLKCGDWAPHCLAPHRPILRPVLG